ncbi:cell envelope integrity protein CreD [Qipengyuania aurantiaca]|nr:cell envelope integrity protein CreD [Qipengyuania aurantiaca]
MRKRSAGFKLFLAGFVGLLLVIPLLLIYGLVSDRQHQARIAQDTITAGSGGPQILSGPVLVVPYEVDKTISETVDGKVTRRTSTERGEFYLSPAEHTVDTALEPERKKKAQYETVLYLAQVEGRARFVMPDDLARFGINPDRLLLDETQVRFGTSDPRGLRAAADVRVDGAPLDLEPGEGVRASGGSGFHGEIDWSEGEALAIDYSYAIRGSRKLTLIPRGGQTDLTVTSPWKHPGFSGSFLPDTSDIGDDGFTAKWSVGNLALGQPMVMSQDLTQPSDFEGRAYEAMVDERSSEAGEARTAVISLIEPADIYAQVDRSVKYGFLFIGFTFVAFFLFDVVGGARVAAAEYLLTGAGLVLFFVLLLAFAEWTGFALAYVIASAAIISLLTAYSAAVLGGWRRASFVGAMLVALYGVLYVLLSLEAAALIVGSLLMFAALAGVMYATRNVDWSAVGGDEDYE